MSNAEECAAARQLMAEKLNRAKGPTAEVNPMQPMRLPGPLSPDPLEVRKPMLKTQKEMGKTNERYRSKGSAGSPERRRFD